jgi:ubiquinone/menaquinone biosynthesis C-methylase UbiE
MSDETEKPYRGAAMEGRIAKWYAINTGKSLDEFRSLAREVAAVVPPGSRVLEVAPGPGYFAIELAKCGNYQISGLDISRTFVEIARENSAKAGFSIDFRWGNAAEMPFEGESFDFLLCRAAFKNFSDPVGSLREMSRVLKPGGRGRIIDMRRDATSSAIAAEVRGMGLSWFNRWLTRMTLRSLRKRAYTEREFRALFAQAGFRDLTVEVQPIGLGLRFGK